MVGGTCFCDDSDWYVFLIIVSGTCLYGELWYGYKCGKWGEGVFVWSCLYGKKCGCMVIDMSMVLW